MKLLLRHHLSPGDVLMLTAAVRDLHRTHPSRFQTAVDTSCQELWEGNPLVTPEEDLGVADQVIDCAYPHIHKSNQEPIHFSRAFHPYLAWKLGVRINPGRLGGEVYLSAAEREFPPLLVRQGHQGSYWIVVAGGKHDFTAKWWDPAAYQAVVDHFAGRVAFVQCGESSHWHPPLRNVINLVGQTSIRQLIQLVHHADGVICPVTLAMHLAAAVPLRRGQRARGCVVIAGGREPVAWEMYPNHQFLHTIGALECCAEGGCWKGRCQPIGDGDEKDQDLCSQPVHVTPALRIPRCMQMITPQRAISAIELYVEGGAAGVPASAPPAGTSLTEEDALREMEKAIAHLPACPAHFSGRGIVIPAGGEKYLPSAYVAIRSLRASGCRLPIQVWHLGPGEMPPSMRQILGELEAQCVDAMEIRRRHPCRILRGWELKPYAILHSPFEQVMLLDADNMPLRNPEFLLDSDPFGQTGAIFWPDRGRLPPGHPAWRLTGVPYRDEPELETGQVVLDKPRCWRPLALALWMNEQSDFWYRQIHGDKETFHLAWRKLKMDYALPPHPLTDLRAAMIQHDFEGRPLFQHRSGAKWMLEENPRVPGFAEEERCRGYLADLRMKMADQSPRA